MMAKTSKMRPKFPKMYNYNCLPDFCHLCVSKAPAFFVSIEAKETTYNPEISIGKNGFVL